MKPLLAAALVLLVVLPASAGAKPRAARCDISTEAGPYRGPCRFLAERGGSFSLTPPAGRRRLLGDVTLIGVAMIGGGGGGGGGMNTHGLKLRRGGGGRSPPRPARRGGPGFPRCAL